VAVAAGALPRAVFFDAYGTLLALDDPVGNLQRGLRASGYFHDAETVAAAFRAEVHFYRRNQDHGSDAAGLHVLRARCAAVFAQALPSRPPVGLAAEILVDALRYVVFDDVLPTLDELALRGVRCAVVSNWDCSLSEVLAQLGILERFATVSVSAVVGARKPDSRIFNHALALLGLEPNQVVHVGDDVERDIRGARAADLRAVLIDRSGRSTDNAVEWITSLRALLPVLG
jgi:FMN phosphatase YigB (HAD superfamily)